MGGGALTTKCGVLVYIVARAAGARGPCLLAGRLPAQLVLDHLSAQKGARACAALHTSPGPEGLRSRSAESSCSARTGGEEEDEEEEEESQSDRRRRTHLLLLEEDLKQQQKHMDL